jgi:DNA-binding transcriptional ArsR family regulator
MSILIFAVARKHGVIDKLIFTYKTSFVMKDVFYLERLDQAEALLRPGRIEILRQLAEPASCTDVAGRLSQAPQKVYYHVKQMEQAGLVDRVAQRQVRGITEGIYQASGASYWLAPTLVGAIGRRRVEDEMSLGYLLSLSEQLQTDLARLALQTGERPSLGLSGEVRLQPERRTEFLADLRTAIEGVLTRYGGAEGAPFRIALACYPGEE